jgi:hypothetical protein
MLLFSDRDCRKKPVCAFENKSFFNELLYLQKKYQYGIKLEETMKNTCGGSNGYPGTGTY